MINLFEKFAMTLKLAAMTTIAMFVITACDDNVNNRTIVSPKDMSEYTYGFNRIYFLTIQDKAGMAVMTVMDVQIITNHYAIFDNLFELHNYVHSFVTNDFIERSSDSPEKFANFCDGVSLNHTKYGFILTYKVEKKHKITNEIEYFWETDVL